MGLSTVFCQVECSESSPLSARRTAKARLASSGTIAEQQRLHMKASMAVYFHLHSTSISVIKIKHTDLMVFCQQHVAWCFSGVFCAVRRRLRYCQPISAEISSAVVCAELAMKGYKHVSRLFNKVKLLDYLWTWRFCLIWHLIQGILSKITVLYYNPHPLLKENTSIWNSKTNQAQAHRAGGFTRPNVFRPHKTGGI